MDVNFLITCHYVNMLYSWLEMKRIQYLEDRLAYRMDEPAQKLKIGKNETGKYSNILKSYGTSNTMCNCIYGYLLIWHILKYRTHCLYNFI